MTAIGVMLIGFGILTAYSGWELVNVFDLLRSFVGAPAKANAITPNPNAAVTASTAAQPAAPTHGAAPHGGIPLAPGGSNAPVVI